MGIRTVAPMLVVVALVPFACSVWSRPEVPPDHAAIAYVGRFDMSRPEAPRFAWPASEVRLRFTGPSVRVRLTETPVQNEKRDTDWITVLLDGRRTRRIHLREGTHDYVLAQSLSRAAHELALVKRTEAEVGTITLHGFVLGPGGAPQPTVTKPTRRIEVIGDSISAGYGNEGRGGWCRWSAATEDASRTYATIAAGLLGAEARVLAWSGKGVLRNYDPRSKETMLQLFERTVPTEPDALRADSEPPPDAVVIALGTNDFFSGIPEETAFMRAYRRLLDKIRVRAPGASVFAVLSPMLADDSPHENARSTLKAWLSRLVSERRARGERITLVEQWVDPSEGVGCDVHPSIRTHQRLGRELADTIRSTLGW